MEAENQCIEYAIRYKHQLLDHKIREIKLWTGVECPSLNKGWIEWKPTFSGKMYQILLTPIAMSLLIVISPLLSVFESNEQWQRKMKLKKEQRELEMPVTPYEGSGVNNIESLWRRYGLDECFGFEHQIHLIEKWVEILYGSEVAKRLDLEARSYEIRGTQFKANSRYYHGDTNAPHFYFMPVADCLIRDIVEELPTYSGE